MLVKCLALTISAITLMLAACSTDAGRLAPNASGDVSLATEAATAPPRPSPVATTATAVPTANALPLAIVKKGFGIDESGSVGYAFIVRNPNASAAIDTRFQVALYDGEGVVLNTDSSSIPVITGGQQLGVAGSMSSNDPTRRPVRIEVEAKSDSLQKLNANPPQLFDIENPAYTGDRFFKYATGVVVNSHYDHDMKNVEVFAVAYDASGNIVGGGYTFLDFVPVSGKAAVKVDLTPSTAPATVELYATVSNLTP
jgi:hypothetical protein